VIDLAVEQTVLRRDEEAFGLCHEVEPAAFEPPSDPLGRRASEEDRFVDPRVEGSGGSTAATGQLFNPLPESRLDRRVLVA
jgi:hypothetical protein